MRNAIVFPISSRPPLVCGGEHPSAGAHQDGEAGGAMQKVGIFLKVFERYKHGLRDFFCRFTENYKVSLRSAARAGGVK